MIAAAKPEAEDIAVLEKAGLRVMVGEAQVLKIVPVSTVTLWRMVKRGEFPPPTFITANKKIWWLDEIQKWQGEVDGRGRGRRKSRLLQFRARLPPLEHQRHGFAMT